MICPMTGERERPTMTWFCEIRSADNVGEARLRLSHPRRREDCRTRRRKKMKRSRQPDTPDVGRIMVGQNAEKAPR